MKAAGVKIINSIPGLKVHAKIALVNRFEDGKMNRYSLLADLCGIAYYILLMVIKDCNRDNTALLEVLRKQSRRGMLSCILYTTAIGASFISAKLAGILIFLVAIMWLMPDRNIERSLKE